MYSATAEPELDFREANHRFLDTLAALCGFLRADFCDLHDPAVRQAVGAFSSRIQAFACVHRTLGEDPGEALVDAPAHMARLCAGLCDTLLAPRGLHCELRTDPGALPREICQTLDLIVADLVASAAKHTFAGRDYGRVSVGLRRSPDGWVCVVADNRSGCRGGGRSDRMMLVRRLAHALGGDLCIHSDPQGMVVTLSLPESAAAHATRATTAPCHA
jgi:two-component sensor histidine kinase